jgi:hypothetical protein
LTSRVNAADALIRISSPYLEQLLVNDRHKFFSQRGVSIIKGKGRRKKEEKKEKETERRGRNRKKREIQTNAEPR